MGSQRYYKQAGGFSKYFYRDDSRFEPVTINGVSAKVIVKKGDDTGHDGLPTFSNTSDMYFKAGRNGEVIQGSYYSKDRKIVLNFDWGHNHYNAPKKGGDGKRFEKGVVHVQLYITDKNGKIVRKDYNARMMNNEEIKKFGAIIKHFNPNVKFKNDKKKK